MALAWLKASSRSAARRAFATASRFDRGSVPRLGFCVIVFAGKPRTKRGGLCRIGGGVAPDDRISHATNIQDSDTERWQVAVSVMNGNSRRAARASRMAWVLAVPFAAAAASETGCSAGHGSTAQAHQGSSGASGSSGSSSAGGGSGPIATAQPQTVAIFSKASACQAGKPTVGPSPVRRISRVEYDNMVRDLLGDHSQPALQFVSESPMSTGVNFETNTYTTVQSPLIPQQYLEAAEALAANSVSSADSFAQLVGCAAAQQTDACAQTFIDSFANRAFRGQYDSTESKDLFTIYSNVKAAFDFATGIQAVITSVLTSPRFLFVLEFGQPGASGTAVALTPTELATRLALFLWRSVPDGTLLSDAAAGALSTPSGIQSEVQRMLKDANSEAALDDFATQWLELQNTASATKDTQFTGWTASIAGDLQQETLKTFYHEVAVENSWAGGTLTELLTSNESYINTDLAKFYGVSGGDDSWATKTNVNPPGQTIRAGILTDGSVMATQAHTSLPSPVLRGKLVREQVLCDVVPDPPAAIDGVPIGPPPSSVPAGQTTNQQFVQHLTSAACSACHQLMDPIGFGFANFDATGAFQATDSNGQTNASTFPAIDAGGMVLPAAPGELSVASFNGPVDLATQLASAPQVQQCYTLQQFRYALGRLESPADACSLQQAFQSFSSTAPAGQFSLQQLLIAIAQSDAFRYRNAETAGSECQ
jgi:hypothetical protein